MRGIFFSATPSHASLFAAPLNRVAAGETCLNHAEDAAWRILYATPSYRNFFPEMRARYLPRQAQEVCLDCAAELTMDAPRPPAVTSSCPLNSFICSKSTAISHAQNQNLNSLFSSNDRQITQAKAMRWVLTLTQLGQESLAPRPTCDTCLTSVGYPISISCSLCTAARPQRLKLISHYISAIG